MQEESSDEDVDKTEENQAIAPQVLQGYISIVCACITFLLATRLRVKLESYRYCLSVIMYLYYIFSHCNR